MPYNYDRLITIIAVLEIRAQCSAAEVARPEPAAAHSAWPEMHLAEVKGKAQLQEPQELVVHCRQNVSPTLLG
jgi:hypothetical protein